MELRDFAEGILFGATLEQKLTTPGDFSDAAPGIALDAAPRFPGRPQALARPGKVAFPKLSELSRDPVRGEVLHFFANHELLAMEIMALVLLRFPDAPRAFRLGVARTITEEQSHMRLYIERMRELGVDFGELPVSEYFWTCMREMKSPMEFVTQMSLTFEQANLDFACFYRDQTALVGDTKTAAILDRVFKEEIGHVKHGVQWFNRWREPARENDWLAYQRLLPPPLTPRRAKGLGKFCAAERRDAGLSETFVSELEVFSASRGSPPVVWHYNPLCEAEIARGSKGLSPTAGARRIIADLEHVPAFLARSHDVVLVERRPTQPWLKEMKELGFEFPELRADAPPVVKLGGFQPWGWSPAAFERLRELAPRMVETSHGNTKLCQQLAAHDSFAQCGFGKFFSKAWSASFFSDWLKRHGEHEDVFGSTEHVGSVARNEQTALEACRAILGRSMPVALKAPYSTSGMGVKKIEAPGELGDATRVGWIRNVLRSQGELVVEPWLDKLADLSMQLEVRDDSVRLLEARRFFTGSQREYRGTWLERKLGGFGEANTRFLARAIEPWQKLARELGSTLAAEGFRGSAGIDALLWKDSEGALKLKPLVELNPRWTMGRVALELESHLAPDVAGCWLFLPFAKHGKTAAELAQELRQRYPVTTQPSRGNPDRLELRSGVVFTNDPAQAQETLTVLAVGQATELARELLLFAEPEPKT